MKKPARITALNEVLNAMFHDLKMEERMEHVRLRSIWNNAVGERIAANTSPALVRKGVLFVNVSNSVWVQELGFMRDKILEKINSSLSGAKLSDIRFKIGPVSSLKTADLSRPLPPLSEQEEKGIDREAATIEDAELKDAFKEMMGAYLKSKKAE